MVGCACTHTCIQTVTQWYGHSNTVQYTHPAYNIGLEKVQDILVHFHQTLSVFINVNILHKKFW